MLTDRCAGAGTHATVDQYGVFGPWSTTRPQSLHANAGWFIHHWFDQRACTLLCTKSKAPSPKAQVVVARPAMHGLQAHQSSTWHWSWRKPGQRETDLLCASSCSSTSDFVKSYSKFSSGSTVKFRMPSMPPLFVFFLPFIPFSPFAYSGDSWFMAKGK